MVRKSAACGHSTYIVNQCTAMVLMDGLVVTSPWALRWRRLMRRLSMLRGLAAVAGLRTAAAVALAFSLLLFYGLRV